MGIGNVQAALEAWHATLTQEQRSEIDRRADASWRSGRYASNLRWYGCVDVVMPDGSAFKVTEDSYHVYLWKRIGGEVFYVGSGKGGRCYVSRKHDFGSALNGKDAIVYVVAYGLTLENARALESRIIYELSKSGQPLRNKAYNANNQNGGLPEKIMAKSSKLIEKHNINELLSQIVNGKREGHYCLDEIQMFADMDSLENVAYVLGNDFWQATT